MTGIVPDVNIEGQVLAISRWLGQCSLAKLWIDLALAVHTFAGLGWDSSLPDREVWNRCQTAGLVLITDNRNHDDPDSLEATLRDSVQWDSLPVLTVSDKDALRYNPTYAEQIALDLLEALSDIKDFDRYRGAGRVFLPLPKHT